MTKKLSLKPTLLFPINTVCFSCIRNNQKVALRNQHTQHHIGIRVLTKHRNTLSETPSSLETSTKRVKDRKLLIPADLLGRWNIGTILGNNSFISCARLFHFLWKFLKRQAVISNTKQLKGYSYPEPVNRVEIRVLKTAKVHKQKVHWSCWGNAWHICTSCDTYPCPLILECLGLSCKRYLQNHMQSDWLLKELCKHKHLEKSNT